MAWLGLGVGHWQLLALGHRHAQQLAAAHDQGGEFALLVVSQSARLMPLGVQHGCKRAQGLGVDAVGIGKFADATGEVAAATQSKAGWNRRKFKPK